MVLGKPNFNKRVYILDEFKVPVPIGIPGEIYVGGKISRGYIHNEALTQKRFVQDPFSEDDGARMYQTGDMGRFLPGGNVEFLGRTDFQVQIRGIRVEPAEIDVCVARHPGISECVTIAREDGKGEYRFISYFVPKEEETCPSPQELAEFLRGKLPYYLMPSKFVSLNRIPLLLNGKIDRKSLPTEEIVGTRDSDEYSSPRNKQEFDLVALWELVLNVKQIGIHDNFFDLGGNSMNILRVCHRIKQTTGKTISVADIFAHPTIAKISQLLENGNPRTRYVQKFGGDGDGTPLFFLPGITRNSLAFSGLALLLSEERPCYGLELPQNENGIEPLKSFKELAAHCAQEIRKIQPEGPYNLAGFSFGGIIAHETAFQLESVSTLFLFDSLLYRPVKPSLTGHIKWSFNWLLRDKQHYLGYVVREVFQKTAQFLRLIEAPRLLPGNEFLLGDTSPISPDAFYNDYSPEPVDSDLLIFTARDTEYSYRRGTGLEAWRKLAKGRVEYSRIDTPLHNNVLDGKHINEIYSQMTAFLAGKSS